MVKKIIVSILTIFLVFNATIGVSAIENTMDLRNDDRRGELIYSDFITSTIETGKIDKKVKLDSNAFLSDIVIRNNKDISIILSVNGKDIVIKGELCLSNRNGANGEILVAEFQYQENGWTPLYFEIFNSKSIDKTEYRKQSNCFILNEELLNKNTVIFYILDEDGNMYVFEQELDSFPDFLNQIDINKLNVARDNYDYKWFIPYVNVKSEIIPATEENLKKYGLLKEDESNNRQSGSEAYYRYGDGIFYREVFNVGGDTVDASAYPYFEGYIYDTEDKEDWMSSLRLTQSTYFNGQDYSSNPNMLYYTIQKNTNTGDFACIIGAGDNTIIKERRVNYLLKKSSNNSYSGAVNSLVGQFISIAAPKYSAAYSLLTSTFSFISSISKSKSSFVSTSSASFTGNSTRADYVSISDSSLSIFTPNNYISYVYDVDKVEKNIVSTYATINWRFSVRFSDTYTYNKNLITTKKYQAG